jgi:hypothetical protein
MFRHHTISFALSSLALLALTLAPPQAHARFTQPAPMVEAEAVLDESALEPEMRVISEGEIARMAVLSASEDEIAMEWETATGCTFELALYPQEGFEVISGEFGRCDFGSWFMNASEPIDPGLVLSVWENQSLWEVFAHLASSGSANDASSEALDVPNAEQYTEIETASECGKAIANAAFTTFGCGAGLGFSLAATGASFGGFALIFVPTISVCGLATVSIIDAMDKCEKEQFLVDFSPDELFELAEFIQEGDLRDYMDVEDLYEQYVEVESMDYDISIQEDAVDMANHCWEILSPTTGL